MKKIMCLDLKKPLSSPFPKSEVFSMGLMALYCLDTKEFNKQISPTLTKFIDEIQDDIKDYLFDFEIALQNYLDDFRRRNLKILNINYFYILKSMLAFSPSARPSIQQLHEDFPKLFPFEV